MSAAECYAFAERALERAGVRDDPAIPYQRALLQDLKMPLDEEALAYMLAYWKFDVPRLLQRGRGYRDDIPAKPRIDIVLEITTKGNFKAEWFPRDTDAWGLCRDPDGSDFVEWRRYDTRQSGYFTRPSNETFFLHGVQQCIYSLDDRVSPRTGAALDHVLLTACAKVVVLLKERLNLHFDVRMVTDLLVEWEDDTASRYSTPDEWSAPDLVTTFKIIDPVEHQRALELTELEEIEGRLGCTEETFVRIRDAEMRRDGAAAHTLSDRVAREMKKRGISPGKVAVARALYLVDKYRNVVPIRRD